MTLQEIFDHFVETLEKQGGPTSRGAFGACRYHQYDGKMCAVGMFIVPSGCSYEEGQDVFSLPDPTKKYLTGLAPLKFWFNLQNLHDNICSSKGLKKLGWKAKQELVSSYGIETSKFDEYMKKFVKGDPSV